MRSASQPLASPLALDLASEALDLRQSASPMPQTPKSPRSKRSEQDKDSAHALTTRRLGVGFLGSARDAMKTLIAEFDVLLGDMGVESQELLDRVLHRAAAPEEWQSKSSDAMQRMQRCCAR